MIAVLFLAACAQAGPKPPETAYAQTSSVQTYAMVMPVQSRMKTSSDCGENVDHILTHLENLMIESGHMTAPSSVQ